MQTLKLQKSEDVDVNSSDNSCKNLMSIASSLLYMWGQGVFWLAEIGCVISGM